MVETNEGEDRDKDTDLGDYSSIGKTGQAIGRQDNKPADEEEKDYSGNHPPNTPPVVVNINQYRNGPMTPYERWYLRLVTLTLGAAIITASFIWAQFREMNNQTIISSAALENAVSDSMASDRTTRQQIQIAQAQADALQDQVRAIQRQIRQDQRPWIKTELGSLSDSPGQAHWTNDIGGPLNVPIRLTNTGKTPAKHVTAIIYIKIISSGERPQLPLYIARVGEQPKVKGLAKLNRSLNAAIMLEVGRIAPGDHLANIATRVESNNGKLQPMVLTKEESTSLNNKSSYLLVFGYESYLDGFGISHWSKFCMDFFPDGQPANIDTCEGYSDDDHN